MKPAGITSGQRAALALLATYTGGTFDAWQIAGDRFAFQRQQIMNQLAGTKVPRARCGVTALREAFHAIAMPAGGCVAERDDAFAAWAAEQLASTAGDTRGARPERLGYAARADVRTLANRRRA